MKLPISSLKRAKFRASDSECPKLVGEGSFLSYIFLFPILFFRAVSPSQFLCIVGGAIFDGWERCEVKESGENVQLGCIRFFVGLLVGQLSPRGGQGGGRGEAGSKLMVVQARA